MAGYNVEIKVKLPREHLNYAEQQVRATTLGDDLLKDVDEDLVYEEIFNAFLTNLVKRPIVDYECSIKEATVIIRWHTWTEQEGQFLLELVKSNCTQVSWGIIRSGVFEIQD